MVVLESLVLWEGDGGMKGRVSTSRIHIGRRCGGDDKTYLNHIKLIKIQKRINERLKNQAKQKDQTIEL